MDDEQVEFPSHAAAAEGVRVVPTREPGASCTVPREPDFEMQPARQEDCQGPEVFPVLKVPHQQGASHAPQAQARQEPDHSLEKAEMVVKFDFPPLTGYLDSAADRSTHRKPWH